MYFSGKPTVNSFYTVSHENFIFDFGYNSGDS